MTGPAASSADADAAPGKPRFQTLETVLVLLGCVAAAIQASKDIIVPDRWSADAFVHQYWAWSARDPALFTDPLTAMLRDSGRYPIGYETLFELAAKVTDPIQFGEWLGVALMAISAFLVFLIVREHGQWRPGAWIAAALFLALYDITRFQGGFQRAFVHPAVLLTVWLSLRGRVVGAAATVPLAALVYPPAGLLAGGVFGLGALLRRDRRRLIASVIAAVAFVAVVLAQGGGGEVLTAAQARALPEFSSHGTLPFFVDSPVQYLRQNRSGFDFRQSGSTVLFAALALLLVPAARRRLRPEVVAMPIVALIAFGLAQLVLFKLYLPHRYTYPLLSFFAIAVGVCLLPAWQAALRTRHKWLPVAALLALPVLTWLAARYLFPLGPRLSLPDLRSATAIGTAAVLVAALVGGAVVRRAAIGAAITGALLVGLVAQGASGKQGNVCLDTPAVRYIATLPKDAIIAGDPNDLTCLPGTARRAVVISSQLAASYEPSYLHRSRTRMFAMLRAYYGSDPRAFRVLRDRYGATDLWVRRDAIEEERRNQGRWFKRAVPFGQFARRQLRQGEPLTLRLPKKCQKWARGEDAVYSMACLANPRTWSGRQR